MTATELIAALDKGVSEDPTPQLAGLVAAAEVHKADADVRKKFLAVLQRDTPAADRAMNVLSAGFFGVLPGGPTLLPTVDDRYQVRVSPFLHALRMAILSRTAPADERQAVAKKYIFYPEFVVNDVRSRVSAIARAHSRMGKSIGGKGAGLDELAALYSLGGFFPRAVAANAVNVTVPNPGQTAGGTTCVMTARAIYHAAGANMIGTMPPTINTPKGGTDLGAPRGVRRPIKRKDGTMGEEMVAVATVERADLDGNWRGYDNDGEAPPQIRTGDIYLLTGEPGYMFLMRGGAAVADHVGIVVNQIGDRTFETVDGGAGTGADVVMHERRTLAKVAAAGWTFTDAGRSYSEADIQSLGVYALSATSLPSEVERCIMMYPEFAGIRANYKSVKEKWVAAAGNEPLRKRLEASLSALRRQAVLLSRVTTASRMNLGKVKTIRGWWQPERYPALTRADRTAVRELLGP